MHARRRVVLTRSPDDNARVRSLAGELDVEWIERTCITYEVVPVVPELLDALRSVRFDAAVFPSRRAVEGLFRSGPLPAPSRVVAVGSATRDALASRGWSDVVMPREPHAASVVDGLDTLLPGVRKVLHARGETATESIQEALRARGVHVTEAVVYRPKPIDVAPLPSDDVPTLVVLASPETVRIWLAADTSSREYLAIGPSTAAALRAAGRIPAVADAATAQGLAAAVAEWAAR